MKSIYEQRILVHSHPFFRSIVAAIALVVSVGASNVCAATFADRWRLIQETTVGLGYDSNVNGNSKNEEESQDGFVRAAHELALSRRNSFTRLEFTGIATANEFFQERDASGVDTDFTVRASYPVDGVAPRTWETSAYWRSRKAANLDLGERVRRTEYGADGGMTWNFSPKVGAVGRIAYQHNDYSGGLFNADDSVAFTAGLTHAWRPKLAWSGEYQLELGHSRANQADEASTNSTIHTIGLRAQGELRPKLTGTLFGGLAHADFGGSFDRRDSGPAASADLRWAATIKTSARARLSYRYEFSGEGEASQRGSLALALDHEFNVAWRGSLRLSPYRNTYARAVRTRDDTGIDIGASFEYLRSGRFSAQLDVGWTTNDSSNVSYSADRAYALLNASLRY